jgi:hypothetical protein
MRPIRHEILIDLGHCEWLGQVLGSRLGDLLEQDLVESVEGVVWRHGLSLRGIQSSRYTKAALMAASRKLSGSMNGISTPLCSCQRSASRLM